MIKIRLPSFSEEEKKIVKGTADFVALNFYSATVVEHNDELAKDPHTVWNYDTDQEVKKTRKSHWIKGKLLQLKPGFPFIGIALDN